MSPSNPGLPGGQGQKGDMPAYKFWNTQPVPKFGEEETEAEDGPLKIQNIDDITTEPADLLAGFEWCVLDIESDNELDELWELLNGHYVEDDDEQFRFNYSRSILKWALMSPGWKKEWHVGIRASQSRRLVAFISAIPMNVRVRSNTLATSEVNFICVHKKLRSKRLAPVLIKEITRLCNLQGVWQAVYTAGVVLPKPVGIARYYHRILDWEKLYEVGFCGMPFGSTRQVQVQKYELPDKTTVKGLREMEIGDIDAVTDLLSRYLTRYELAPVFDKQEIEHWMVHKKDSQLKEQVIWSYVVEDENKKITDFFSFYLLETSAINSTEHAVIGVAYLFYYATEVGLQDSFDKKALKNRLNSLMADALVLANNLKFDVFNGLSIMDNALFLEEQKFALGDGKLHYYLFNYRTATIAGGMDHENKPDEEKLSGLGLTMM